MRHTRRQSLFAIATTAVFLSALAATLPKSAWADTVSQVELMQPGPLGDESLGAANAPVTIIEYASMTCSHCAHFDELTLPKLKEKYIDTGRVRFIFREFPFDPVAAGAFMLARCAGPGKFFPMIELLFRTQQTWAVDHPLQPMLATVRQAGFTEDSFKACLANQKVLDGIEWVRARGADKFKIDATPTFFVNGERVNGAVSFEEMEKVIRPYLKG